MLIVLCLYAFIVWLVFAKLHWIRWTWASGTVTTLVGVLIFLVFLGLFNVLTPTGRFVIGARVVEVTPSVSGQIVSLPLEPNVTVSQGTVLFRIDATPFELKVRQLEASLVSARQQALQLKESYEQATANVEGLVKALDYHARRLEDTQRLIRTGAATPYREQDIRDQVDSTTYQLAAARAAQQSARHALDAEVDGVHASVSSVEAQLANAKWELDQTIVRAPARGYISGMAVTVGDRATPMRSILSFIVSDETTILGLFAPNGFETIVEGAPVKLVFDDLPGRIFHSRIAFVPRGIGQGQLAASGMLPKPEMIRTTAEYPAMINIPAEIDRSRLRLGMPGSATVYASNAGVIGLLRSILVWIGSYVAYL